jgi:3-oxoacyl-[acyl-carrier-protein] synthase II
MSPTVELAITGWSVISSVGIGIETFSENVRQGRSGARVLAGYAAGTLPFEQACTVPEFEATRFLGSKRTRTLDRATTMAVTATGMALQHSALEITPANESQVGVVLGTSNGSLKSTCEFTRQTFVQRRPHLVSPELFPNTVMNCAAGQCAIWHKLKAVNTTIAGGRLAGLLALRYAARILRAGYAEALVTGGVEEFSEELAWGAYHTSQGQIGSDVLLGEGGAMFVLEPARAAEAAGRTRLATVLACEAGVYASTNGVRAQVQMEGLAACIRRALDRAGVLPDDVWGISARESGFSDLDDIEDRALRITLGTTGGRCRLAIARLAGDCFSASGALQLAGLLALFARDRRGAGRIGVVTSLAHGGGVGCAVIREG